MTTAPAPVDTPVVVAPSPAIPPNGPAPLEGKAGIQTSEFWVVIAGLLLDVVGGLFHKDLSTYETVVGGVLATVVPLGYAFVRSWVKVGLYKAISAERAALAASLPQAEAKYGPEVLAYLEGLPRAELPAFVKGLVVAGTASGGVAVATG